MWREIKRDSKLKVLTHVTGERERLQTRGGCLPCAGRPLQQDSTRSLALLGPACPYMHRSATCLGARAQQHSRPGALPHHTPPHHTTESRSCTSIPWLCVMLPLRHLWYDESFCHRCRGWPYLYMIHPTHAWQGVTAHNDRRCCAEHITCSSVQQNELCPPPGPPHPWSACRCQTEQAIRFLWSCVRR